MGPVTYGKLFYSRIPLPASSPQGFQLIAHNPGRHLLSTERLPFTGAYFGSIALTLYFALGVSLAIIPPRAQDSKLIVGRAHVQPTIH